MGTVFAVSIEDDIDPEILTEVSSWWEYVEQTFSTFRSESQISAIGRGELEIEDAAVDVRHVLAVCAEFEKATEGRFSIRPGRPGGPGLDPAGFVKGWSVDEAALMLRAAGAIDFAIYAGGDVLCSGRPADAEAWSVGVRLPQNPDAVGAVLTVNNAAVASSGTYERGEHIWGPESNSGTLLGATVVGPNLGPADALATAIFSDQGQSYEWLSRFPGYSVVLFTGDGKVKWSTELDHKIEVAQQH